MKNRYQIFVGLLALALCRPASGQESRPPVYDFDYSHNHIVAESQINDTLTAHIILDTGGKDLLLDSSFVYAHRLTSKDISYPFAGVNMDRIAASLAKKGIKVSTSQSMGGGVGNGNSRVGVIFDSLHYRIAGTSYSVRHYRVHPRFKHSDGLMGITPTGQQTFEIDYVNHTFRLYPGAPQPWPDKSWTRIKLKRDVEEISVPLRLKIGKKTISGDFLLDTGSSHAIFLGTAITRKYHLEELDGKRWKASLGLAGESEGGTVLAQSVEFGKDTFNDVDIHFSLDEQGALSREGLTGIIGNLLLEKYDVIIDFVNLYLYLRPNALHGEAVRTTQLAEPTE